MMYQDRRYMQRQLFSCFPYLYFLFFSECIDGSKSIAVQIQNLRFLAFRISWFVQPSHPFQKASSSVSSLNVTGTYPSSVFIFITAAPLVSEKILALGHRSLASWNEACLILLARPNPLKSGCTISPEVATYCLFPHDSIYVKPAKASPLRAIIALPSFIFVATYS